MRHWQRIKEYTNKWRFSVLELENFTLFNVHTTRRDLQIKCNLYQQFTGNFAETENYPNIFMKPQKSQTVKAILRKNRHHTFDNNIIKV